MSVYKVPARFKLAIAELDKHSLIWRLRYRNSCRLLIGLKMKILCKQFCLCLWFFKWRHNRHLLTFFILNSKLKMVNSEQARATSACCLSTSKAKKWSTDEWQSFEWKIFDTENGELFQLCRNLWLRILITWSVHAKKMTVQISLTLHSKQANWTQHTEYGQETFQINWNSHQWH